ncbi:hypothetical protein [Marinobacter sp. MIT932201]|uniref:hypothetical protein n=1 Tax=Marinobacter sp. MIT932201 TaxID=3096995 RepID=UPI003999EF6A
MAWSAVSGLVGLLVGLILGHRLALGRDKRKEFNEATSDIRKRLSAHIGYLEKGNVAGQITEQEVSNIVGVLGESRSADIRKQFDRYSATLQMCSMNDGYGMQLPVSPGCKQQIIDDAQKLYRLVQPK